MEKLSFKLTDFEGPLDLLLHLISKHQLNINDIPIFTLVEQYLRVIESQDEMDLETASEFLDMAARLIYIKTVSLLPVHEEAEKLKTELRGDLLEYRDCKVVAQQLSEIATGFNFIGRSPEDIEPDLVYKRLHEPEEILAAYQMAVGKGQRRLPPPVTAFTGIVSRKIVSVASKIVFVMRQLWKGQRVRMDKVLQSAQSRSDLVATFLAVLELVKAKRVRTIGVDGQPQLEIIKGEE